MKFPLMFTKNHIRVVSELEKDKKVQENKKSDADKTIRNLKSDLSLVRGSLKIANDNNKELVEQNIEFKKQIDKLNSENEKINRELLDYKDKVIKLEWCIKERDKDLADTRKVNGNLLSKVQLSNEMYRQFKDKIDKACEIDFVTKVITPADVKKFMKVEDIVELYALIGLAGK